MNLQKVAKAKRSSTKRIVTSVIIGLVGAFIGVAVFLTVAASMTANLGQSQKTTAEGLFYDMLGAAAAKKRVYFAYVEHEFKTKTAFEANKPNSDLYSVAEFNEETKDYRAVFASFLDRSLSTQYTFIYRCFDGKTFKPTKLPTSFKTLDDVKAALQQPFVEVAAQSGVVATNDCDVAAGTKNRKGKLTDGIIPLGLNTTQIQGWLAALRDSKGLSIEDGGETTYQDKKVRKVKLTTQLLSGAAGFISIAKSGAGLQFSSDTSQLIGPDSYRLDDIAISKDLTGFYLVDEQTKLPVYSEFTTLRLVDTTDSNVGGFAVKQKYMYPDKLTLTKNSLLDVVE